MKKQVNILIMEPKPLSLDLTKKAIQTKPDDMYHLHIVGTAITAKAGYFELYKHKPHVLLLNPELPDEDGASFIQHALERVPHLKIIPMISRFQNEDSLLEAGAVDVLQLPVQKSSIWMKLDQQIETLDSLQILPMRENDIGVDTETDIPDPLSNLLNLEDDSTTFNPIFQATLSESDDTNTSLMNEDFSKKSSEKYSTDDIIITDEEVDVMDFEEKQGDLTVLEDEDDEMVEFDPFDIPSQNENNGEDDILVSQINKEVNSEDLNLFFFEESENESTHDTTSEPHMELKQGIERQEPIPFVLEEKEETNHEVVSTTPLKSNKKVTHSKNVENIESEKSSNQPRTPTFLYSEEDEYNKTNTKENLVFEKGFLNRNGAFVPVYPPREHFGKTVVQEQIHDIEMWDESDTKSEGGILSSVKKIFKR